MRKMKDSGIEWIGKIPENWNIKQIKTIAKIYNGKEIEEELDCNDPNSIRVFGSGGVFKYTNKPLYKGEAVLFGRKGTIGKPMIASGEFWTVDTMYYSVCNQENDNRFLYYILTVFPWEPFTTQTALPSVVATEIFRNSIGVPSLSEQKKIADFLDGKRADIDQIKADIEKQIEILTDYKKSVITEAVTKGLNPKTKLKDSGIEWIGKIPEGWDSIKAKYLFKQRNSRGNTIDLQLLSPSQKFGVIPQSRLEELTTQKVVKLNEKVNLAELKTIHQGDFCISLRSFQGGFEYSEYEGVVSPAYQVFYSIVSCCNGYYRYLFKEKSFIEKMNSFTMSLRDGKNIAFEDFANSEMPVPPLPEQKAIADYLDEKCSAIDATIADKQRQLETLDEYKKSLIFEYVTGKKEVLA